MATRPMQVWNGSAWEDIGPQAPATAIVVQSSTPTGDSGKLWIDTSADVPTYASMAPTASPSFTGTSTFAGPVTMSGGSVSMSGATSVTGAGMDLITPTSVAGSGVTMSGGAISFSAASTVSVNGCFSASYDNYLIMIKHVDASSSGQLNLRMRLAGSDASTGTYFSQYLYAGATTVSAAQSLSATSARVASSSGSIAPFNLEFYSPFIAEPTTFLARSAYTPISSPSVFVEVGGHSVATSYDGFSILNSATTMTGTLRIYGLRNS